METHKGSAENGKHRSNDNSSVHPIDRNHGERETSQMTYKKGNPNTEHAA